MQKFTLKDFKTMFPDDAACLDYLRREWFPEIIQCSNCGKNAKYYRISTRKVFGCEHCGYQISPTAGTIFHKSSTPLTTWFYVIYLMAQTRTGISAKQIQRETGVTYKTAWRMCREVRKMLNVHIAPLSGNVEMDESYFGGRKRGTRGRGSENKVPVFGMVERKGRIKAVAVPNVKSKTVMPIVANHVKQGTRVHTDEYPIYNKLSAMGYPHEKILHAQKIYVAGDVHTQTIDGFWGNIKGGINGVYRHVSPKYLQHYLDEYSFRYNHRDDFMPMFLSFLSRVKPCARSDA